MTGRNRNNIFAVVPFKVCTEKSTPRKKEKAAEFHSLPVLGQLDSDTSTVKLTAGEVISWYLKKKEEEVYRILKWKQS